MTSDFFDPPPQPTAPEQPRYRMPAWMGPPRGMLPGMVAIELVLARTDTVAVCITRLAAYPTGFELDVLTLCADAESDLTDPRLFDGPRRHRGEAIPPEMLRLGVEFADGRRATNTGGFPPPDPNAWPEAPVMMPVGGGGGGGRWQQTLWIWPLPPAGPLALVCGWPAAGIPVTRSDVDAQLVLDAAAAAQVLFSDEHLPLPPGLARDG